MKRQQSRAIRQNTRAGKAIDAFTSTYSARIEWMKCDDIPDVDNNTEYVVFNPKSLNHYTLCATI